MTELDHKRVIHKVLLQPLPGQDVQVPKGSHIIDVQNQNEDIILWYDRPVVVEEWDTVHIVIIGTGHEFTTQLAERLQHINTIQMLQGTLVWHVYRVIP